jgi:hypothetical protein
MSNLINPQSEVKQPQVRLSDTKVYACACGGETFAQGITLREVSALLSGTGKVEYVLANKIYCVKCLVEFKPSEIEQSSILTP